MQRVLTTVVILGLLLASAAAFAITEHLKLIKSPIYDPQVAKVFSPVCHCPTDKASISFKLRHPDSVTVTIVGSGRNEVDTIATDVGEPKGKLVTFYWDGNTTNGLATNGSKYQPKVHLANARRTILMPNKIEVDTSPPAVVSASTTSGNLIRGSGHPVVIRYVFPESAYASVYIDGHRVLLSRQRRKSDEVKWNGKAGGKLLPAGRYVLDVAAVDRAGNETPPAERKPVVVVIRDIALGALPTRVAPGKKFTVTVRTRAPKYTWRFAGKHGSGKSKQLSLRAPAHRGRYRLVVTENGRATTAIVTVGKA
ncbi:MAG TPA: hypothetical protein VGH79_02045 [Gaiellaceae bacterium]